MDNDPPQYQRNLRVRKDKMINVVELKNNETEFALWAGSNCQEFKQQ